MPPSQITASRFTASKDYNLAQSWPPSASPNAFDNSLQVHHQTRSIMASRCISLDHGLKVHHQTHSNMSSTSISSLARPRPPSAHLWTHSVAASQCISILIELRAWSTSPTLLHLCLAVYHQVDLIMVQSLRAARRQTAHHQHFTAP